MPPENAKNHKRTMWISIVAPALSFGIGLISAAYFIGGRTGKLSDIAKWQTEEAPKIERALIERDQYIKKLAEFDARIKRVEEDTAHFDVLETEHRRLTKDVEELKNDRRSGNGQPRDNR